MGRVLVSQGHIPPPDPSAPGAFAMADPGRIRELVVEAGFAEPEIEEVTFRWPFAEKDAYWHYVTETSSSSSPVLRALSPECRTRFGSRCTKRLGRTDWRGIRLSGRMPQRRDVLILSRLYRFVYRRPLVAGFTLSCHHSPHRGRRAVGGGDPGNTVVYETRDAFDGQLNSESTAEDVGSLNHAQVHPPHGTVFVKGAEPRDLLEVKLVAVEADPWEQWGYTVEVPDFLRDEFSDL